ncbi:hypothetical protein ABIB35_001514 [Arthrobacter sp. UYP6]
MGQLVTVMVSSHLVDGCDVAKDAMAALVAGGWTPPERLPGFEDPERPTAEAGHEQHETDQNHAASKGAHRVAGADSQNRTPGASKHHQQTGSDEAPATAVGSRCPQVIHGPSLAQEEDA